jgi:hypothetical protein
MANVTYARLDEALRALGFSFRAVEEGNRVYHHESGALVVFPDLPAEKSVLPRHLLAVKSILNAYGIVDTVGLASEAVKAS